MTIHELKTQMWMSTPKGEARAIMMIDYGPEDDLYWVCIQQEDPHTGQIWVWHNSEIRVLANRTMLRGNPSDE